MNISLMHVTNNLKNIIMNSMFHYLISCIIIEQLNCNSNYTYNFDIYNFFFSKEKAVTRDMFNKRKNVSINIIYT